MAGFLLFHCASLLPFVVFVTWWNSRVDEGKIGDNRWDGPAVSEASRLSPIVSSRITEEPELFSPGIHKLWRRLGGGAHVAVCQTRTAPGRRGPGRAPAPVPHKVTTDHRRCTGVPT